MLEYAIDSIIVRVGWYFSIIVRNTVILFGVDNRIMKIIAKQYYHDINIIAVLNQKPLDFIV